MATIVCILTSFLCLFQLSTQQGVDLTRQRETTGAGVVRAVVNRVQVVFNNDSDMQILRRIAFVESRDGTNSDTYRPGYHGGIWQVDEDVFLDTQDTTSHPELVARHEQIMNQLQIDWPSVQWTDLRKPLYSGLAARLLLLSINSPIPCNVAGQARYWKMNYDTPAGAGTEQGFIADVQELSTNEGTAETHLMAHRFKLLHFLYRLSSKQ